MPSVIGGGTSMRLLAIALTAILALTVASLIVGTLEPLPSVALGAAWLLHVELRALHERIDDLEEQD